MKAGRELDALVAEKVMGITRPEPLASPIDSLSDEAFARSTRALLLEHPAPYSTDIATAWTVVEKMREIDEGFTIMFDKEEKQWRAGALWWRGYEQAEWWEPRSAMSETAPHAICLAALKAVGAYA